ncbi:hypothetical protein FHG87_006542 [Trinorchestia longiramus]|nr:hypothetical protein FHG87_006542 [Trinorchestia longiramus]
MGDDDDDGYDNATADGDGGYDDATHGDRLHPHANRFTFDTQSSPTEKQPHDLEGYTKEDHRAVRSDNPEAFKLSKNPGSTTNERNFHNEFRALESPTFSKSSHNLHTREQDNSLLDLDIEEDAEVFTFSSSSASTRARRSSDRWRSSVSETDERFERAAISRQAAENQLHKPRSRNRGM